MKLWKYYNQAMIPAIAPHEKVDESPLCNKQFWSENEKALFARWTSEFDCGYETNWWYVIKDDVFDLSALKSNYRYKINKGIKNFDVRIIDPQEYVDELYEVFVAAFESWPAKYRPQFTYNNAKKWQMNYRMIQQWYVTERFIEKTGNFVVLCKYQCTNSMLNYKYRE